MIQQKVICTYGQITSFKFYIDLNQLAFYVTNVPVSLPELYHPYRSHITLGPINRILDNTSSCHSVKPAQSLICNTGESNYESVHHSMLSLQGSCNHTVQDAHWRCHRVGRQIIYSPLSGGHPPRSVQAVARRTEAQKLEIVQLRTITITDYFPKRQFSFSVELLTCL